MSTAPTPHHKSHQHPVHSQYTYQRPSTLATRNIVSPTPHAEKPTLYRQPTDHYERAVAAAKAAGEIPKISSPAERPAGLDRKQSWKKDDLKRDVMAQMLEGKKAGRHEGYTSASGGGEGSERWV